MRGMITAIRTLTAIPCPGKDADEMSSSLPWFPIVGFLIGSALLLIAIITQRITGETLPEITAIFIVLASALLTRGIHLDGLADFADGFWGSMQREKVLKIMKDSCIGTYGTIALIIILLTKWVCIINLLKNHAGIWIVAAMVISRTIQVNLASLYPYARQTDGTGAPFIKNARPFHAKIATITATVILMILLKSVWIPIITIATGWIISILLGAWSKRRIGGVTGDIIGAGSELTETAILIFGIILYQA